MAIIYKETCSFFIIKTYLLFIPIFVVYSYCKTLFTSQLLSKNLKIKIYKTIILPILLYGCETWSLTLREECRLRVFENWILGRIFGPKRHENGEKAPQ